VNSKKRIGCLFLGVLSLLAPGGLVAAEELWVAPTHVYPPGVSVVPWATTGTGLASFGFAIPDDFAALDSVQVVLIPTADINGNFDVFGSVKRDGETAVGGLLSNLGIPAKLVAKKVSEIDITGLLSTEIDHSSAGTDYVSVHFRFPASPGLEKGTVLGLRFVYEAVSIVTTDIENRAVTNAKLADGSVNSAKVANNSLTGTDIADGSLGSADVNLTQIQGRVSGNCSVGQSIRSIGQGGTVTCEPDSEGMVIATLEYHTCNASTACTRTVDCDSDDRITGGGMRLDETFTYATYNVVDLVESYPNGNTAWTVTIVNNNSSAVNFYVYAACQKLSAASSSAAAASTTATTAVPLKRHADQPLSPK
jgi:hypothetical protein